MRSRSLAPVLALLAMLTFPGPALACSCSWAGPFTRAAPGKALIILGEIQSHHRNSMDVTVVEVIRGREERARIRIWGDNGALCRPYVSGFPIGTTWLLAVSPLPDAVTGRPDGFSSPPGAPEYAISVCGEFWLEIRGDRALGRITVDHHSAFREWVPVADMVAWLRSNGAAVRLSPIPMPRPRRRHHRRVTLLAPARRVGTGGPPHQCDG